MLERGHRDLHLRWEFPRNPVCRGGTYHETTVSVDGDAGHPCPDGRLSEAGGGRTGFGIGDDSATGYGTRWCGINPGNAACGGTGHARRAAGCRATGGAARPRKASGGNDPRRDAPSGVPERAACRSGGTARRAKACRTTGPRGAAGDGAAASTAGPCRAACGAKTRGRKTRRATTCRTEARGTARPCSAAGSRRTTGSATVMARMAAGHAIDLTA